jgi:hypothetical protein
MHVLVKKRPSQEGFVVEELRKRVKIVMTVTAIPNARTKKAEANIVPQIVR